jgi:hypothetical protein
MAKRRDTNLFQVLIGQFRQNREIDIIFGKTLGVRGHAELYEPIRNEPHRQPRAIFAGVRT